MEGNTHNITHHNQQQIGICLSYVKEKLDENGWSVRHDGKTIQWLSEKLDDLGMYEDAVVCRQTQSLEQIGNVAWRLIELIMNDKEFHSLDKKEFATVCRIAGLCLLHKRSQNLH